MNNNSSKSPQEIEKEFNRVKFKINEYILTENRQIPPDTLFRQLDKAFEEVKTIYKRRNDNLNLLHVEHNYLWSKIFQFLQKNPTHALELFIIAFSKLIDRHVIRPYSTNTFERMLGPYLVALIQITEKEESINFNLLKDELNLIKTKFLKISVNSEKCDNLFIRLYDLFLRSLFLKNIDYVTVISSTKCDLADDIIKQLTEFLYFIIEKKVKDLFLPSFYYENLYKIRKKQLHYLVRFIFFEQSDEKKRDSENKVEIIIKEMIEYSNKSFSYANKHWKSLPNETKNEEQKKSWIILKELDVYTSEYYQEVYLKKDILKAWKVLDKIKQFLVIKSLKENISLSPKLLRYYGEEWSLLYIFAKICLFKDEVNKRMFLLGQEWEKEVFLKISNSLGNIQGLFKYQMVDKKDYSLKIITSTFSGSFSEYFIHELCLEFFSHGKIDTQTSVDFLSLFNCIKKVKNKDHILLNYFLEQSKPDIDIYIKNECSIFLKNSKIKSKEMKQIWKEIELCNNHNIKKIFYCINFIKNIEKLEYIREQFQKIKKKFNNLEIETFDVKDLISEFLNELKRIGKSKLNFSQLDLSRVLDY